MPTNGLAKGPVSALLTRRDALLGSAALTALCFGAPLGPPRAQTLSAGEARAIAKEAYIYGFPLVDSYRIQHSYFVDTKNPEYKGNWNEIHNTARVYTPEDKAIQSPNSDTPYSFVGADLRAEPLVLSVPEVEEGRYYSIQFIDMYTFNFAYVGSRATGNGAGSFLLAGPGWKGEKPAGVKDVIHCETELALLIYRTQLFGPDDIGSIEKIQAGYRVEPLSAFLGQPAPAAPAITFATPLSRDDQKTSAKFFDLLNFVLQFCPVNPTETEVRERFASLGIGGGKSFDADALSADMRAAVEGGIADAWADFDELKKTKFDTGEVTSGDMVGTRDYLKNNYLYRMAAAVLGIYGNSKEEAMYPAYFTDADGKPTTGANRYTLRFAPDGLPPVNAFWSLTLYKLPESLLSANALRRYLINSPMLPKLTKDADGGLTLYIQNASPGGDKEANWLPAPEGPFFMAMRLYWPKQDALDGKWKAPPLTRVN
jgi:hypothetical protein